MTGGVFFVCESGGEFRLSDNLFHIVSIWISLDSESIAALCRSRGLKGYGIKAAKIYRLLMSM